MPGENCAFYGCSTSRKHGLSLFKLPACRVDESEETSTLKRNAREQWLNLILRTRESTPELKKRIEDNNIYVCELHFKPECINKYSSRKVLITGSIPTENLPSRSHEKAPRERRPLVRHHPDIPSTSADFQALTIQELFEGLGKVSVLPWTLEKPSDDNELKICYPDADHTLPKFTVTLNTALEFTVYVFNWPIPDDHSIYLSRKRCIKTREDVIELLTFIENSNICHGLPQDDEAVNPVVIDPTWEDELSQFSPSTVIRHSIPKSVCESHFKSSVTLRSPSCHAITTSTSPEQVCEPCSHTKRYLNKITKRKRTSSAPAKSKASLAACGPEKLRATVLATRLECKQLQERVEQLESKIQENGVGISQSLENDILKIMGGQNLDATPHMKLFWQQQMKLLQSKKMGRRYHPQIIRFALSLYGKSPAAYKELRSSGALILPSERVLRDYKNYFKPKAGLNLDNIETVREKASSASGIQRYVVLVMDEMKIQSNLVFDKYSGDLVGFVDLGDPATNYASLGEEDVMATHALAFLVRGMCSNLKHVIAYYFTENVTSYQIISVFRKIVGVLELSLNLWVIAAVNDGASPNRKFFELHSLLAHDLESDVVYKVPNAFASSRFNYFFADACHLIKIARNCLYNSGSGSRSRLMWNNGKHLMFRYIADLFYSNQGFSIHVLPKRSLEHIALTPYSKMKVKVATQVLSHSVAIALEESGDEEVLGTAEFCRMMNDYFDCSNVRSLTEHVKRRNDLVKPYTSEDDDRFTWLKDVFLQFLEQWKQSIMARGGNYSTDDRGKMFLSIQTYKGLKISVFSHIEAIKFLLSEGFRFVLSERFQQDVVEDYFGHQRAKGGRSDNPTAHQFGYNDLTIAVQRDIAPVTKGNVGGRLVTKKWDKVCDEPLKKRKKTKKDSKTNTDDK